MSERALELAVEAKASADGAHHRLDRINGSLDHMGREIGDLRGEIAAARAAALAESVAARTEAKANHEAILLRLGHEDGIQKGAAGARLSFFDSKWRWITLVVSILTSGLFVVIATYALRS